MRNQPTTAFTLRTPLTAVSILSLSLLLWPLASAAAEPGAVNNQLREQNRELQARLDAHKADGKEHSGDASEGGGGKVMLFTGRSLGNWVTRDKEAKGKWKIVNVVELDPSNPNKLVGHGEGQGADGVMVLEQPGHGADIYTEKEYGDGQYHVEFLVPGGSNSGVYLMGLYEVQILDSYGKKKEDLKYGDVGGVYSTKAPSENAAKAPGEWQSFDIVFRAPRFDASGKKVENARFVSIKLNGKTIQENVEVLRPTGSELPGGEKKPVGPLMFQGDHGAVAFRNVWVIPADGAGRGGEGTGKGEAKGGAGREERE